MYLENSSFQRGLQIRNPNAKNILVFIRACRVYEGAKVEIKQAISENRLNFNEDSTVQTKVEVRIDRCDWRLMGVFFKLEGYEFSYEIAVEKVVDIFPSGKNEYEIIEAFGEKSFRKTNIKKTW
jgi:hypothetical protein